MREMLLEQSNAFSKFNTGELFDSYHYLGCQKKKGADQEAADFTVWAPNAKHVFLVGDFCDWVDGVRMEKAEQSGMWTIKMDHVLEGDRYKYKIVQQNGEIKLKIDPMALSFEHRPKDASVVKVLPQKKWTDALWLARRKKMDSAQRPMNIYEMHAGSWKKPESKEFYTFSELSKTLVPYVKEMGYTHIEFMPIMEHPLDASWGYQLTGYFAVSSRYGTLDDFLEFINECHINNIGVLMDWVPGHFCRNDYGLAYYDGTAQYEYFDKNRADNQRWGALNFNLSSPPVQSFLVSSAMFWLKFCHLDGLRVDAVSSMLYLDYDEGAWTPNEDGNNVNYEGMHFLKKLTSTIKSLLPDVLLMAEESTAYPMVTGPIEIGGLGFDYKWNMGWMNDILRFFEMDPLYRHHQFNLVTFSFVYMFDEKFILPLSHDEVVHGKRSLMHKMPGDRYNQFANLRTLFTYMMCHPGKSLVFMGSEWGQFLEWKEYASLEWIDLEDELNKKMQHFTKSLNHFYKENRALWELDHSSEGIEIVNANEGNDSVLTLIRKGKKKRDFLVVICNFVPVQHLEYEVNVPYQGTYEEVLNTELLEFGGTWTKGQGSFETKTNQKESPVVRCVLPAMSVIILKPLKIANAREKKGDS